MRSAELNKCWPFLKCLPGLVSSKVAVFYLLFCLPQASSVAFH